MDCAYTDQSSSLEYCNMYIDTCGTKLYIYTVNSQLMCEYTFIKTPKIYVWATVNILLMSGNEILNTEKLYMFTISNRCQYYLCYTKDQVNEMKELVHSLLRNIASEFVLSSFS